MKNLIANAISTCTTLNEIIPIMREHKFEFVDSYAIRENWNLCFDFDSMLNDGIKIKLIWDGHKMIVQVTEEVD